MRVTESPGPVLDARGPRRRLPDAFEEAPTALPPPPVHGAHARGSQRAIDARGFPPPPAVAPPMPPFAPPMPIAPPRAATYTPPSYDMTAATSYDKMVRRIIWIALLVAGIVAVVIATR